MENSRRLFDKSREPGLKKPRLDEQIVGRNLNGRGFVQSTAELASGRGRDVEGVTDTHIQELASQYKAALAELTINSKPIINNLTIIAGESLHAAKAIAAIICSNILEVPTEQKLPSLYLLDSIVKNIGRDYMKHFVSRLPEVFCKAYRQVDPAVRAYMRHLFGTWRTVFPSQSLQMIRKELGFPPVVSNSASGKTVKPGSQSERPAQSVHVNPKYLEARQQQQSSKVKGTITDINESLGSIPDYTENSERTANLNSVRQRADPRLRMHNIQHPPRDEGSASFQESSSELGAYNYDEFARQSAKGVRKTSERVGEQGLDRTWYGSDSSTTGTRSTQRNGSDTKLELPNYLVSRSPNSDANLQSAHNFAVGNNTGRGKSWKNSEEEDYMWDDMNLKSSNGGFNIMSKRDPRLMDNAASLDARSPLLKSHILHENENELSVEREPLGASLLSEQRKQIAVGRCDPSMGHHAAHWNHSSDQISSEHIDSYPATLSGLSTHSNSMVRTSFPNNLSGSSGSVLQPLQPQSVPHLNGKTKSSGLSDVIMHSQFPQNMPMPVVHRGSTHNFEPINSQSLPCTSSLFQQRHHIPSLQRLQSNFIHYDPAVSSQKSMLPLSAVEEPSITDKSLYGHTGLNASQIPGHLSVIPSFTAVMENDILGENSVNGSIPKDSCQISMPISSLESSQPSLPSGPLTQSEVKLALTRTVSPLSHEVTYVSSSQRQTEQSTLPHGSSPSSIVGSALKHTANVVNATCNPMSSLLNTLVAKGLISASNTESVVSSPPQFIGNTCNQIPGIVTAPIVSSPFLNSSAISPLSAGKQLSFSEPTVKNHVTVHKSSLNDVKSHIGFEFKPDVIRVSHPVVLSELLDDLPHLCSICGLRVKLKECLDRHMEWHAHKKSESSSPKKASRRWYVNSVDWIEEKVSTHKTVDLKEVFNTKLENGGEEMIPADENNCVCVLCGEVFEDLYNQKLDQWMFKGAVYMSLSTHSVTTSLTGEKGPVVHTNCISESTLRDLGLSNDVKVESDA